jgi:hypothetical protein
MMSDQSRFVTLGDLMHDESREDNSKTVDIPILAEAVEKRGIYGHDEFGRFKKFKKGSSQFVLAMEALAAQHRWNKSPGLREREKPSPASGCFVFDDYEGMFLGWRERDMPPFKDVNPHDGGVEPPAEPTRTQTQSNGRGEKNALALVGVMLAVLLDKTKLGRKSFASEAQLIEALADKEQNDGEFAHVEGLGKTSLEQKFAKAKEYAWKKEWRDKK